MKQIAKNSTEYWARRKAEFVVSQLDKAENTAEIMKQTYAKAQKHLVDQADKIFLKYQRDYKLSETQARAILKRSGVDVMKLKRELQNGVQSDEIKQILTDMDSAAYASRIEKLIQSQKDIDNLMLGMSKNDNKLLTNHLKNIADDSYLHEMFMLQKRAKVAFEFGSLDPAYVDKLLHVNWSGKHFSQAIWNNHAELGQTLKEEYLVNYLTGRSSFDMAKVIEYRFGVEGYKARRLVRTESTFFSAELEAKAYEEAGIEQYEYVSVLDDRTTHVCKSKDGKIYNVKDRRAGVNYPPLHVFCRATTIAHISDEWLKEVDGDVFDDTLGFRKWIDKFLPTKQKPELGVTLEKIKEKINSLDIEKATKDDMIDIGEQVDKLFNVSEYLGNHEKLTEIFSNFREIGGEITNDVWQKGSNKVVKEQLQKSFSLYPKEWAELPKQNGYSVFTKKLKRGYFSNEPLSKVLTIVTDGQRATTPYHEIAHMVEFFNPHLVRIEKEWVDYRTGDEFPTQLRKLFPNAGYSPREVVKKDNFIDPYIGKYYKNAAEVLSMGLQGIFVPEEKFVKSQKKGTYTYEFTTILDDKEFLNLVIGLFVTV